jgi:hypothetical protein
MHDDLGLGWAARTHSGKYIPVNTVHPIENLGAQVPGWVPLAIPLVSWGRTRK